MACGMDLPLFQFLKCQLIVTCVVSCFDDLMASMKNGDRYSIGTMPSVSDPQRTLQAAVLENAYVILAFFVHLHCHFPMIYTNYLGNLTVRRKQTFASIQCDSSYFQNFMKGQAI